MVVERMLRKLANPQLFVLPPASVGHIRHFMPWFKKGPDDRTLVLDGFVCVGKATPVISLWPDVELDQQELRALERITSHVNFFGRAESWVEVRMLGAEEAKAALAQVNCKPSAGVQDRDGFAAVRVLCADPISAFDNESTPKHRSTEGKGKGKKTTLSPLYDPDWNLCMETLKLHSKRWSDPPGSQWVNYLRRKDCFGVLPQKGKGRKDRSRPTMARFSLDGAVLPLVEDTLRIAESARRTAMGIYRRIEEQRLYHGNRPKDRPMPRSEVFSGKDENGHPLKGHRHAYYIPSDEDGDGRIDHLTIVAAMGFGTVEVKVLDAMCRLPHEGAEPLDLVLLALGQATEICAPKLAGPARVWISATPYIATRFPKARGRKKDPLDLLGLDNQRSFSRQVLQEELERLCQGSPDMKKPQSIEYLNEEHRMGAHRLRPIQFKRFRRRRSDDGGRRPAGAFRIVFPEPVLGPLCLGHSSHFGLGLFVPGEDIHP
jgi:CRISPR-associated protein Csb2